MSRRSGRARGRHKTSRSDIAKAAGAIQLPGDGSVPRGGVALADAVNALTARPGQGGFWPMLPLPRDMNDTVSFGPLHPLAPAPLDPPRRDTGRPEPRIYEYPVGWNIPGNDNRPIPWDVLRQASTGVDIIARCIEVRKKHVRSLKWSWSLTEDAISDALRADPKRGQDDVENDLREKFLPEIRRLNQKWRKPWPAERLNFGQWVNAVLHNHLVFDGVAVYPRRTFGGDLAAFELIDPPTVKLLLDSHGRTPVAPHPAYQQVLYGFPRGEFVATTEEDPSRPGQLIIPNGYTADSLYYHRENFRTGSPYGLSAVEQALLAARLYLKRQGWMLAEYDDGSTPLTWLVPDGSKVVLDQLAPQQRRVYERAINDDLAGDTARRHRIKMSYPGYQPLQMESVDERYKPDYDLHLIKWVASFFGVMLTELGFTEAKGLGNSGLHEGQAAAEDRVGLGPDVQMLSNLVDELGHSYQGAPPELEFKFIDESNEDEQEAEAAADGRLKRGSITLNEDRKRVGMAPYDFEEADKPFIMGTSGPIFLEGALARAEQAQNDASAIAQAKANPPASPQAGDEPVDDEEVDDEDKGGFVSKSIMGEVTAYRRWLRKNAGRTPARSFRFEHATPVDLEDRSDLALDPELVEFADWIYVEEDIVKALGADIVKAYEPWWPRDARGRWIKRGHLSDVEIDAKLPEGGREALRQIRDMEQKAQARKPKAPGRVPDTSGKVGSMTRTPEPRSLAEIRREADAVDRERMQIDQISGNDADDAKRARIAELRNRSDELAVELREAKARERGDDLDRRAAMAREEGPGEDHNGGRIVERQRDRARGIEPGWDAYAPDGTYLGGAPMRAQAAKIIDEHVDPKLREGRAKASVRDSVGALEHRNASGWVSLADVRDDLDSEGFSRAEQDAALRALARESDVRIVPVADQGKLRQRDRDAGLKIGVEMNHAIQIGGDPSQRDKPAEDHSADLAQQRAAAAPKPDALTTPDRARAAYRELGGTPHKDVSLSALRERLGGTKDQQNDLLIGMLRDRDASWSPEIHDPQGKVDALRSGKVDRVTLSGVTEVEPTSSFERTEFNDVEDHSADLASQRVAASEAQSRKRLTGEQLSAMRGNTSREEFREQAKAHGLTDADVDAELDEFGISRERQPGEATSIGSTLSYRGSVRQTEERQEKARAFTPEAYTRLLGDGRGAITHKPTRAVVESMQANGWTLREVSKAGSTWEAPDDSGRRLLLAPGEPPWFADRGGNKLTYKRALETTKPTEDLSAVHASPAAFAAMGDWTRNEASGPIVPNEAGRAAPRRLADTGDTDVSEHMAGRKTGSGLGGSLREDTSGEAPKPKAPKAKSVKRRLVARYGDQEVVINASTQPYTHAAVVEFPDDPAWGSVAGQRKIMSFHKSEAAARKGNLVGHQREGGARVVDVVPVIVEDEGSGLNKAAEGDDVPKADATSDERWPAWLIDTLMAEAAVKGVASALETAVSPVELAAEFVEWVAAAAAAGVALDVLGWLRQRGLPEQIAQAITPALEGAWAEGWLAGEESAARVVDYVREHGSIRDAAPDVDLDVEWEWPPGHPEAARRILSEDGRIVHLRELLNARGVRIRGITDTQLDDIASVLSDGIEAGKSPGQIATALQGVVRDRKRALRIAVTEVNRAVSAATLEAYRRDEIPAKGWLTALDQRVCPVCADNEAAGALGLDEDFPSGDPHPPAHPRCRCALIPEWPEDIVKSARSAAARTHHDIADEGREYWTRDPEGLAKWAKSPHPWTALYRHLVTKMSPVLARKLTSTYFKIVFGYPPSARQGSNPVGRG